MDKGKIHVKENAVLFDAAFCHIQKQLVNKLDWLDNAFGNSETHRDMVQGTSYVIPMSYKSDGEYVSLLPSDLYGNFCFFYIDDPVIYDQIKNQPGHLEANINIIFWINQKNVFYGSDRRIEDLRLQIIKALNISYQYGSLTIDRIYDKYDNIYKGFTIDHERVKYFMYPYVGFRFACKIRIKEHCKL